MAEGVQRTKKTKLLDEAKERYVEAVEGWREIYDAAAEDIEFCYDVGEGQWPDEVKKARGDRPTITVNKVQKYIRQIRADQMQNRARIKVIPVDDQADVEMAELYNGLIRQIEYQSGAEIAYDTAYGCGLACSIGYFMIDTGYADDASFDQDIFIKRIIDPFSVRFDPQAKEFTLEDARYCFVEYNLTRKEYEDRYGDDEPVDWDGEREIFGDWLDGDRVRICKYYYKKPVTKRIAQLSDKSIVEMTKELPMALSGTGLSVAKERTVESHEVWVATISGVKVLDETLWPGKHIPVIPVFGDEIVSRGKRYYLSLARGAKGPQQMYNYWADLSIKTRICTPSGWELLENIHIGDSVFDEKGKPCKVIGESPILNKEKSYKVMFSDGSVIVASADHLWTVNRGLDCVKVVQTREIDIDTDSISMTEPLDLPEKDLKINPYTLGLWLADGNSRYTEIFAHEKTVDELAQYLIDDGCVLSPKRLMCQETETYSLYMRGIRKHFVNYGLLCNKHIPGDYLRASRQQRMELLRGLMDGDGSCRGGHQVRFAVKSVRLAADFSELLYSLGLKGNYNQDRDGINHFFFTAYDPVFKLQYKLERQMTDRMKREGQSCRYKIVFIEEIEGVQTKCITVDSPSHLFLAGDGMIPTHNTAATETVALTPRAPFIVDHRQIKDYTREWNEANTKNAMYLPYNAIAGIPKPQREPQGQVPAGIMAMLQTTAFDIEDHLGRYEASMGRSSNERSGKAIQARVAQSDKGSYQFVDNLTRAIIYAGKQLIDLIPKIYDSTRAVQIMGDTGEPKSVRVNEPGYDPMTGRQVTVNDLTVGKYDLIATLGASYSSKRQEMVQMMIESMQYAPTVAPVIAPLIFKYSDWPGAQEVAEEIKKEVESQREMAQMEQMGKTGGMPPPSAEEPTMQ